ncbi:MAG: glycosyltransferase family 2 protein [Patescibacteria group bacterium]|jgi:glycosyltransferase involved in cell wall biosynthesis
MKILVIIPAKDEAVKIGEVVREVKAQNFDVAVIDDGSQDDTALIARNSGAQVLKHIINRGQGASVKTGIKFGLENGYEVMVFFDADGQMKASEINNVLEPVLSGSCEVALGSRNLGVAIDMPVPTRIMKKLALIFTLVTSGLKLTDTHNGFQAWNAGALRQLNLVQDRYAYASELLHEISRLKLKYREVPVTIVYTEYSKKKGQSIFNAFNIIWDLIFKK